jgi:multiple sugar transport system substrate-binding protein
MNDDDRSTKGFSRRTLLQSGLALAGASAAAPLFRASDAFAQGGFDWKRFKGEKIEIALQKSPFHDVLQKYENEFTALTGIEVGSEQIPEQQYRQKLAIEFASGKPSFDACYVAQATQKRLFGKGKWLSDLRPLLADPTLTAPDMDFADFSKASIDAGTQADGRVDTLPMTFHYNIVMVNKELFQKKGIAIPQSFPALLEAAMKLNDPANGVSGFVARGLKNANTPIWTSFLLGYGVDSIGRDGKLNTDGPEAIAAAELYQKLVRDNGPAGVTGFNWYECQALYMQGKAAIWIDTSSVGALTADPSKSRVASVAGFTTMTPGPKVHRAPVFASGVGIAAASKKQGPAWYWVQWATGKQMQARQVVGGYGASGRSSPFEAAKKANDPKLSPEWLDSVLKSTAIAYPVLPDIVAGSEFRDVYGVALTNMLAPGASPSAELKKATETFKPILEKSEKA